MPEPVPTNERLAWIARYADKVAEKSEGMPAGTKNAPEIARANREIAAACLALIAVRAVLEDLSPIPLIGRLRAILGPQGCGDA